MKLIIAFSAVCFSTAPVFAQGYGANPSDHYVNGYQTNRGTYVEPHYQTNPNSTRNDNYGTSGNYNPHNGNYGSRSP